MIAKEKDAGFGPGERLGSAKGVREDQAVGRAGVHGIRCLEDGDRRSQPPRRSAPQAERVKRAWTLGPHLDGYRAWPSPGASVDKIYANVRSSAPARRIFLCRSAMASTEKPAMAGASTKAEREASLVMGVSDHLSP